MVLNKCCCCVPLRTGAIIIAALTAIGGFASFSQGVQWFSIIAAILGLVSGGFLMFGAIKNHKIGTLLFLIVEMAQIVFGFAIVIYFITLADLFVYQACQKSGGCDPQTRDMVTYAFYAGVGICAMVYALGIYFWLCVYSFYQSLKEAVSNPA